MVHRTLTPFPREGGAELRTHVPMTFDGLLSKYGFVSANPTALPDGVLVSRGDDFRVRHVGWFSVLICARHGQSHGTVVYVGQRHGQDVQWGAPKRHMSRYEAALDAVKLVSSFSAAMCGGD